MENFHFNLFLNKKKNPFTIFAHQPENLEKFTIFTPATNNLKTKFGATNQATFVSGYRKIRERRRSISDSKSRSN